MFSTQAWWEANISLEFEPGGEFTTSSRIKMNICLWYYITIYVKTNSETILKNHTKIAPGSGTFGAPILGLTNGIYIMMQYNQFMKLEHSAITENMRSF